MSGATDLSPEAVKALPGAALPQLAAELRQILLTAVSRNGGHLASSLGAVEIAVALVRVFEPFRDRIVWDVGHQSYAWKLLTGRRAAFATLRRLDGLSGFPKPEESSADAFVAGHAGIALAVAEGLAAARDRLGRREHVVAVVGDASLTNGENLEALNNCTSATDKVILVLNDNAMSISRNVGAVARFLGRLITGVRYNRVKAAAEAAGHRLRLTFLRGIYHRLETRLKSLWLGNAFFERYGLRYIGPVDGHDIAALEAAFTVARDDKRSVVVHVVTQKGHGYAPAEHNPAKWHGVGPFPLADGQTGESNRPQAPRSADDRTGGPRSADDRTGGPRSADDRTGGPRSVAATPSWSAAFGAALTRAASRDKTVCALTAAMKDGTGLASFAARCPDRFFDVGICESYLVSFAAGLAKAGMKPVVAVYSSFSQRAVDQVMHDVCLLHLPVVFAVDRAGCVGADGRTHHGLFDIPLFRCLPGMTICQPKDAAELEEMLALALKKGGPWIIRYPRGTVPVPMGTDPETVGTDPKGAGVAEVVSKAEAPVMIWALGDYVPKAQAVAVRLAELGIEAGVVNARFVKPLDRDLLQRQVARGAKIVTLENGALEGGFGSAVLEVVPSGVLARFGWPDAFVDQGTVPELEKRHGLDVESIAACIRKRCQTAFGVI